jgi:hypothetical protein
MRSREWPAFVGLCGIDGIVSATGSSSSGISSDEESLAKFGTKLLSGEVGVVVESPKEEVPETLLDAALESTELRLDDLPWLKDRSGDSVPVFAGATMALADWPRPSVCGRGRGGDGTERGPLCTDVDVCWLNLVGDDGL